MTTFESITDQLKMCDAWANLGYRDHQLSTAAGQLCLRAQLWGQAKKNFEDAIRTADYLVDIFPAAFFGLGFHHDTK